MALNITLNRVYLKLTTKLYPIAILILYPHSKVLTSSSNTLIFERWFHNTI